ncbi:MAG TPA: prolipoprotein diacylglyceryl transferase [Gammaproteobacteria bacterium]|nr:prolipoprotein diacylglyceryl transferase [Gammaproteobacteria bacterium]
MLEYPQIDPVAIQLGPIAIHWYGLMYLVGFAAAYYLGRYRAGRSDNPFDHEFVDDMIFYGVLSVILGGRIGYVLFYNFSSYLEDPLAVFKVWQGGMSFHGGLLGTAFAMWFLARKYKVNIFQISDFVSPLVIIGLLAGRVGNFINGELWGRQTDVPWAMVFPGAGPYPRHPSQLYEAALEGILLFLIVWFYSSKPRPMMAVTGLFLAGYGLARSTVEFFREPDGHIGFIAFDWLTMGHILSVPMIMFGLLLLFLAYRQAQPE